MYMFFNFCYVYLLPPLVLKPFFTYSRTLADTNVLGYAAYNKNLCFLASSSVISGKPLRLK